MSVTNKAVQWLSAQRDGNGGWGSTAGTVWTIKCLLLASERQGADQISGLIKIYLNGQEEAQFDVNSDNKDLVRQADLSELYRDAQ